MTLFEREFISATGPRTFLVTKEVEEKNAEILQPLLTEKNIQLFSSPHPNAYLDK